MTDSELKLHGDLSIFSRNHPCDGSETRSDYLENGFIKTSR